MSHMLSSSMEDIWMWGRVPATCKADSVRRGVRRKSHKPHPPEGSHPNNFHMLFKQEGAVIYGQVWSALTSLWLSERVRLTEGGVFVVIVVSVNQVHFFKSFSVSRKKRSKY